MIHCSELSVPENGTLVISSTLLGVGTTASYTCNQGHVLVGDVTRTCQDTSGGTVTIGTWSGSDSTCELEIYSSSIISTGVTEIQKVHLL